MGKWKSKNVTQQWACDAEGYKIPERFATQLDNARIFDTKGTQNNPLLSSSPFNEQRRNVIRYSIETNLIKLWKHIQIIRQQDMNSRCQN